MNEHSCRVWAWLWRSLRKYASTGDRIDDEAWKVELAWGQEAGRRRSLNSPYLLLLSGCDPAESLELIGVRHNYGAVQSSWWWVRCAWIWNSVRTVHYASTDAVINHRTYKRQLQQDAWKIAAKAIAKKEQVPTSKVGESDFQRTCLLWELEEARVTCKFLSSILLACLGPAFLVLDTWGRTSPLWKSCLRRGHMD